MYEFPAEAGEILITTKMKTSRDIAKEIKVVSFDIFGTLVNWEPSFIAATKQTLKESELDRINT